MINKEQLSKIKKWHYPNISNREIMTMSGWKLYVFGETVDDSYELCSLLVPVMERYNLTMKVATQHIIDRNNKLKKKPVWSVAVIYLASEIFLENKMKDLLKDIEMSLKSYAKTGNIDGAKSIDGKVHYRYDLKEPVEPSKGVPYDKYIAMYRGEYGDFNISDNPDIDYLFKQ